MKNLDCYLSNLIIGNIKLHNLHWNVTGLTFKAVREYLETLYEDSFEKYDEVAELQKQFGQPARSNRTRKRVYRDHARTCADDLRRGAEGGLLCFNLGSSAIC